MLATIFKLNCLEIVGRRHLVAPFNKRINAPSPRASSTFSKRGSV